MFQAPYIKGRRFDDILPRKIKRALQRIDDDNDDRRWAIIGETGSGKSGLALHIISEILSDKACKDNIALSREDFADNLSWVSKQPKPRVLLYDEAHIIARESMTSFNRDFLKTYLTIRGKNIFHLWATPSLELLDKSLLKDCINNVILVLKNRRKDLPGHRKKPRRYYYFTKKSILQFWEKYETLDINVLTKVRGEYAKYRGWFFEYDGSLKDDYLKVKDARQDLHIEEFAKKYGNHQEFNLTKLGKELNVSHDSAKNYVKEFLVEDVHYTRSLAGRYSVKPEAVEILRSKLLEKHNLRRFDDESKE